MIFAPIFVLCLAALLAAPAGGAPPAGARQVVVVDLSQADAATALLVTSIQGVVNRDPAEARPFAALRAGSELAERVGVYAVREPQDAMWLSLYPGPIVPVAADELVAKVRDRLAGQVLYDPAEKHSLNLAAAAAALLDAALTTKDLGLKTVFDARGRWPDRLTAYRYAVAQVLPQAAPNRLALVEAPGATGPSGMALPPQRDGRATLSLCSISDLRDYLARDRVLAVDLDWRDKEQAALLSEILARLQPGSLILGSPGMVADDDLLAMLARHQHVLIPISAAANLSFHAAHPATGPLHQLDRVAPLAYQVMVTFVYEGGADPGYALNRMRALWDDPARGSLPLGWTVSPALLDLAPAVLQSYFADAWRDGSDELVLAPNGAGYFVPSRQADWDRLRERMATWARAGDFRVAAIADSGPATGLRPALSYYRQAGIRGILLGPGAKLTSGMYDGTPVVVQAVRATDTYQALQAIRDASKETKYIYVSVDPWSLTPSDIAYIVGRLGAKFMVLRPRELLEVARQTFATGARKPKEGGAALGEVMLRPAEPGPQDAIGVRATVRSATELDSVRVVYSVSTAAGEWSTLLQPEPDNRYAGSLPPMLEGGRVSMRVRAIDVDNGITWSAPVSLTVEAPDADEDGLSDAMERFVRSDPANPDTDGDGWRDGNDAHPLIPDRAVSVYLWPLAPPGDAPYITEGGGAVSEGVRSVSGDQKLVYRLPLAGVPAGSSPLFQAVVGGDYRLEASPDGAEWQDIGSASGDAPLAPGAWPIPPQYPAGGKLWVRMSDGTPEGGAPARIAGLSIAAQPDGPSIRPRGTEPAYPAVGFPMTVLASVFGPRQTAQPRLHYSINGAGTIAVPMAERGRSQVYAANVHGALNGDMITYWVTAADSEEHISATRPRCFYVGTTAQETISLLAGRDFEGEWRPGAEWDGSRWSPRAGAVDRASININGGDYRVWVLAAPRGGAIRVAVDGRELKPTAAAAADGWQSLGTFDIARGRHEVTLTSSDAAGPGCAQVLISRDRNLAPPEGVVCDLFNSLIAVAPAAGQTVSGLVDIEATASGNISVVECYADEKLVGRERRPPYRFRWNARRATPGPHAIELRALDHAGELLLTTTLAVEVGK